MAFIWSEGMLEPTEVQEDVHEVAELFNKNSGKGVFAILKDFAGEPVVINMVNVTKISETA